jgi:hypothetical protein
MPTHTYAPATTPQNGRLDKMVTPDREDGRGDPMDAKVAQAVILAEDVATELGSLEWTPSNLVASIRRLYTQCGAFDSDSYRTAVFNLAWRSQCSSLFVSCSCLRRITRSKALAPAQQ